MPNQVTWNPAYAVGIEPIDRQHENILALCIKLADFISDSNSVRAENCGSGINQLENEIFRNGLRDLMDHATEHFAMEAALLQTGEYPLLEELEDEHKEFAYLTNEILTADNFQAEERQKFLVLWWIGHIAEFAKNYRNVSHVRA